jgi:predicted porin
MHHHPHPARRATTAARRGPLARAASVLAAGMALGGPALAIDFGPFSLTGFAKVEVTQTSPYCKDNSCQFEPLAGKEFIWADELVQGKSYGSGTQTLTLFQPYLAYKQDLPRGFKVSALLSQRWRDGKEDFKGFLYDKSIALSHEDYGRLSYGAMLTRAWSMADYPFGSNIGLSDPWASSGAGYGLLTRALRYTSRPFDVAEGDLVLEATYDPGESGWSKNKPRFVELWAQYTRGDLQINAMFQDSKNGTPSAFSHGPFTGPFYNPIVDPLIGGNSQGIAMLMATYQVDSKLELSAGLRGNRWSGAYAKFLYSASNNPLGNFDLWNNPFNVDWSQDLGGGIYKGYPATSLDLVLGARYKFGKWAASTGMLHLGAAATGNPSDRGQSNSATINTLGLSYDYGRGLQVYGTAGMVNYARRGLAPTSMPANFAFSGIDSRIKTRGTWFGAGAVYTF